MPTWNPQQIKAITTKHKNILVSASAGSGKTTVLIARLIDLVIQDHIPISKILAMTFTEAAASEMKKRLAKELHALLDKTVNETDRQYILHQLSDLQNAQISTIHSFCLSILQEYYYMIGLDGERIRNIMDNAAMTLYQQQALEITLQNEYKKHDPAFLQLSMQFSSRPENDDQLLNMIRTLAAMASSKADPDAWLQQCEDMYCSYNRLNDLPEDTLSMFYDYLQTQIILYKENLHKIEKRLSSLYPQEDKKLAVVVKKLAAITPCENALHKKEYSSFKQHFIAVCHAIVPTSPDKEDAQYNKTRKFIQQLEDTLLEIMFDESVFLSDIKTLQPSISKLIELCREYRTTYQALKECHKLIDFDDMEHYALSILQANDQAVAKKYQELFAEIMVDEFQDSNDVQNALIQLISKDNNVFRVGDIKQSIYGFRHAKPKLMRDLIENQQPQDEVIYLSNNYRSKKMIVDFNNYLFERLMNTEGFDGAYTKEDNVETGVEDQLTNNMPVIFHAIDHNGINEQDQTIFSKNDFKASYIANKIIEIKEEEHRNWKDFVVLVRGNARKDDMKAAFDEAHIPYFIDIKYGFYQSSAVQIVLSFLRFCLHPHDDIAFLAILLSPLGMLDAQQITEAHLHMEKGQSYFDYFEQHPFKGFKELNQLRMQMKQHSLSEFISKIYDFHNFYPYYTDMQEKTNLDLLFEKAVRYEDEQINSIPSFLAMIDTIQDAQTAEAIPVGSEEDVVRVMSIHQSKGLQFPVVFLWSNTNQTPIEFKDICICDSDLGIAMKQVQLPNRYVRTTPFRIAMEHKKNKEELEEEMRILYVATTRAQQQMHIVDCVKNLEDYEEPCTMSSIYERNGYTSWILQSFHDHTTSLFELEHIITKWPVYQLENIQKENLPIQFYQKDNAVTSFTTASAAKESVDLPKLTLAQNDGTAHGTMMHEIIEKVPYPYHQNDIQAYADKQGYKITKQDIDNLQYLANQEIYQYAMNLTHYHELPYLVQDENDILHGYIDFMAINDHEIILIDFKSDHLKTAHEFIDHYRIQLKTYEKAMQIMYPDHKINTYIYSLILQEMIQII